MGRRSLVLAVALVLAAVAGFAVFQFLSGVDEGAREGIAEVRVFRAVALIETGTPGETVNNPDFIEESTALLEVVQDRPNILCLGPVEGRGTDPGVCDANQKNIENILNGNVAAGPISAGQLITSDMFVSQAQLNSASLSEQLPQGKVAISLRLDEEASVGGFLRPDDRVNILASASIELNQVLDLVRDPELRETILGFPTEDPQAPAIPGSPEETDLLTDLASTFPSQLQFTQTVLQDVRIIAVGPDTIAAPLGLGLEPVGSQVIVLEVTPDQAELVEFARQYTSIAFTALPKDEAYVPFEAGGVLVDDLFSLLDRIIAQLQDAGASLGN